MESIKLLMVSFVIIGDLNLLFKFPTVNIYYLLFFLLQTISYTKVHTTHTWSLINESKVDTHVNTTEVKDIKSIITVIIGILTIKILLKPALPTSLTYVAVVGIK